MVRYLFALLVLGSLTFAGCDQRTPQQKMEDFIKQESAKLPKRIDEFTTLVKLESKPSEIVYIYNVNGVSDDVVIQRQSNIKSVVRNGLVANKAKLASQIRDKIKMTYVYHGSKKTELFRFTIDLWTL